MVTKLMREFRYNDAGRNCQRFDTLNPTWEQIEAAVRKLDKFQNPFVSLYLSVDAAFDEVPEYEVVGGKGDYGVACSVQGYHERKPFDLDQGDEWIEVWTSDQGHSLKAKNIIHEVDLVLELTRYFCEHADFSPAVAWESSKSDIP